MAETGPTYSSGASSIWAGNRQPGRLARRARTVLKAGALQSAILRSASFSSIATDERGVIQVFNVGAQRMLRYAEPDVVNRITPADISASDEIVHRAQALSLEFGTPIKPGFEALVFKASRGIEDICEQALDLHLSEVVRINHRELQDARIAANRANQAKSDFLSAMSPELRSPLNAILGFAQLMDGGMPAPTPGQKDSIEQILHLSLIESGKLSLSTEPMGLAEVLADCQAMIDPQARKGGIRLDFPPPLPLFVRAARTRVEQVFVEPAVQRDHVQPRRRQRGGAVCREDGTEEGDLAEFLQTRDLAHDRYEATRSGPEENP